jgi:DNA invertase Pin-like site-specific DNA recombinase
MRNSTAIGIVRVSETKGREGDGFVSPADQRERISDACEHDGLNLIDTIEELDVSGGTPLERRVGLRRAVEAVENGEADVIVAAYFDRLVRSLRVQDELVRRVEAAGGQVLAVDVGQVTNGSAGQWLSGTMLGAVSEYQRRTVGERSAEAQARAVARGVAPWPKVSPGYVRGDDGVLKRDPETAPAIKEAFRMRADGAPIRAIRERLRKRGVELSYTAVQRLLSNRIYLGELHFGDLENLDAHEPIIERDLWRAVQRVRVPRGRQPKSKRLLARLGVLRCASCAGRMGVSTSYNGRYPVYRCPATTSGDCDGRATIRAETVEEIVVRAVRERLADVEGRASAESGIREAEHDLERAQADLDAAIRAFAGLEDESATRERLAELREARDRAQEEVDRLYGIEAEELVISASADWDRLTDDEKRDLIRVTVQRVDVAPGRGPDRVTVTMR